MAKRYDPIMCMLDDEGLKKAAEHEADRLLKKYNL